MISQTQDRREYLQTIREDTQPAISYSDYLPKIMRDGDDFKTSLVRSQWKYAKQQIKDTSSPRSLVEVGDLYLLKGNPKRAVENYEKALVLDSNFISAYEKIINALSLYGNEPDAHKYFKELLKITGNRPELLRKYALFRSELLYKHGGNEQEVLDVINTVLENDPSDVDLINTYGFILLNFKNDLNGGEKYFDTGIKVNPNHIHSLNNKAVCLLRKKQFVEAEKIFRRCLDLASRDYPFSHQNLALLYIETEDFLSAYAALVSAEEKHIELQAPWEHLKGWLLLNTNQFELAAGWYEKRIKIEPNNQLLLNNLGFCYGRLGFQDKAEEKFRTAVNISEKQIQKDHKLETRALKAFYNLGRLVLAKGEDKEARRIANRIQEINPDDVYALYLHGATDSYLEKYEEAKKLFEEVLEKNELIQEVYADYSFILASIDNNHELAIKILRRSIELGFDTVLINNNLAYSYIKSGDLEKASHVISRFEAENFVETPPTILATQGMLKIRKGNLEEGNELYDKAIQNLEGKNKKIALQIKLVENARYLLKNGGGKEAITQLINEARELPRSYMSKEIKALWEEML